MSTISIYILVTELVGDVTNVSTLEIVRVIMKKLLGIAAVAAIAVLVADPALADEKQLSDMLLNTQRNLGSVPNFINWVSYIIGVALGVAGVSKLKQHVDNPGQTSIKDGLGRLAASGLFISLPFVLQTIRNTQDTAQSSANIYDLSDPFGDSTSGMSGQ